MSSNLLHLTGNFAFIWETSLHLGETSPPERRSFTGKELADKIDPIPNPLLTGDRRYLNSRPLKSKTSGLQLPKLKIQRALELMIPLATF